MGNSSSSASSGGSGSSSSSGSHSLTHSLSFKRSTGSLGLSRSELERRCKPSGLYPSCPWDDRSIRRLIGDGKLSARMRGSDERKGSSEIECPICFLNYDQINVTKCCTAYICTECFLQMQPPANKKPEGSSRRSRTSLAGSCCPFCNATKLIVHVPSRDVNLSKIAEREEEEQKMIEAKIRASVNQEKLELSTAVIRSDDTADDASATSSRASAFGASLQQHASFRKMSEDTTSANATQMSDSPLLASVEDRRNLEEEMKRQHLHPLAQRLQQEAEEIRNANAAAAAARLSQRRASRRFTGRSGLLSLRGRQDRDWNQIVDAFEADYGEIQSIDDLVVIEAAILLSMEEAARHAQQDQENSSARRSSGSRQGRPEFPLLHAFLSRNRDQSSDEDGDEDGTDEEQPRSNNSLTSRRRRRNRMTRSLARDTAGLILRGMSEEEQLSMAIAMSLRESEQQEGSGEQSSNITDGEEGTGSGTQNHLNERSEENVSETADGGTVANERVAGYGNAPGAATSEE